MYKPSLYQVPGTLNPLAPRNTRCHSTCLRVSGRKETRCRANWCRRSITFEKRKIQNISNLQTCLSFKMKRSYNRPLTTQHHIRIALYVFKFTTLSSFQPMLQIRTSQPANNIYIYGFSPDLGGKNGGVLSMRMQVILDSSFARRGFSPIWGEERRFQGLD